MSDTFGFDRADLWSIPVLAVLWGIVLWNLWYIGSYEPTGARGWRRIIAGWRRLLLLLEQDIKRKFRPAKADRPRRGSERS